MGWVGVVDGSGGWVCVLICSMSTCAINGHFTPLPRFLSISAEFRDQIYCMSMVALLCHGHASILVIVLPLTQWYL